MDLPKEFNNSRLILLKKNSDINTKISDENTETNYETRAEAS